MKKHLDRARKEKNDEFYTKYEDIEKELKHYIEYNKDAFMGKTILCPCDDWEWSNFTKYFNKHFEEYGIKKLICSCIAKHPSMQIGFGEEYNEEDLHGKYYIKTADKTETGLLEDNGDFRSKEVTVLRDGADMIITNPPFSLVRVFIDWLTESDKEWMVITPVTLLQYKKQFAGLSSDEYHVGYESISKFTTADKRELSAAGLWITNMQPAPQHPFIELTKEYKGHEDEYPKYTNYDAINVDKVTDIPKDYDGVMGVPCTFLMKWNKEQFKIVKFRTGNDDEDLKIENIEGGGTEYPFPRILIQSPDGGK